MINLRLCSANYIKIGSVLQIEIQCSIHSVREEPHFEEILAVQYRNGRLFSTLLVCGSVPNVPARVSFLFKCNSKEPTWSLTTVTIKKQVQESRWEQETARSLICRATQSPGTVQKTPESTPSWCSVGSSRTVVRRGILPYFNHSPHDVWLLVTCREEQNSGVLFPLPCPGNQAMSSGTWWKKKYLGIEWQKSVYSFEAAL